MALRNQARQLRLSVQLTSIDLPDKWDKSRSRTQTVGYFYHRPKAKASMSNAIWFLPYDVWKYRCATKSWWCSGDLALSEASQRKLEQLGHLLVGIKLSKESVSFYWDEDGEPEDLVVLAGLVFELAELDV